MRSAVAAFLAVAALHAWAEEPARRPNPSRFGPLDVSAPLGFFIDQPHPRWRTQAADAELAQRALDAWDRASGGLFCFYRTSASQAAIRIYWGQVGTGLGRMQTTPLGRGRAGEVYVELSPERFSPALAERCRQDPLFRDAYVFRTLLHEIGHALGLVHTVAPEDVMYYGGDVLSFYESYRRTLEDRADLAGKPGFSDADRGQLEKLYFPPAAPAAEKSPAILSSESAP